MFNQSNDEPIKEWMPYVIGMAAAAALSTLGSELIKWGIEELRTKYGSPKEVK